MAIFDIGIGRIQKTLSEKYGINLSQDHIWDLVENEEALARMIAWDVTQPETTRADIEARLQRIENKVDEMQNGLLVSLMYEVKKQGGR